MLIGPLTRSSRMAQLAASSAVGPPHRRVGDVARLAAIARTRFAVSMTAMSELPAPSPTRPLYAGGPTVSSVAWGMWRFSGEDIGAAESRVQAALDAGVTLFDTADIYGPDNGEPFGAAEAPLGKVLARCARWKSLSGQAEAG